MGAEDFEQMRAAYEAALVGEFMPKVAYASGWVLNRLSGTSDYDTGLMYELSPNGITPIRIDQERLDDGR